jgi:hypothetical protein
MIPDPSPPFEFQPSGAMRERMRRMIERAIELGVGDQVVDALTEITRRLVMSPRSWGDPLRNFRHAKTVEYRGQYEKFRCIYSVHDRVPIVFMTELVPLEGNPLYGQDLDG